MLSVYRKSPEMEFSACVTGPVVGPFLGVTLLRLYRDIRAAAVLMITLRLLRWDSSEGRSFH